MADLLPTQFELERSSAINEDFNCEPATLAVGDVVHFTKFDTWEVANNSDPDLAGRLGIGMVVKASTAGLPVRVLVGSARINLGTAIGLATDEIIVSANGGKMAPKSDLLSGAFYTRLGYMETPDVLIWRTLRTGIAKA